MQFIIALMTALTVLVLSIPAVGQVWWAAAVAAFIGALLILIVGDRLSR